MKFKIVDIDKIEKPLEVKIDYAVQNYAQVVGEMICVTPTLMHRLQSNPFKREKRSFPVEFGYGRFYKEEVNLTVPEGFLILEVPKAVSKPSFDLRFTSFFSKSDMNVITLKRKLKLNKVFYVPSEYPKLRNIYEEIVSSDQGQVVLERRSESDEVSE